MAIMRTRVAPGVLKGLGLADIISQFADPGPVGGGTVWSVTNPPWALVNGAKSTDQMIGGSIIWDAGQFTTSMDIPTILKAVDLATVGQGSGYVKVAPGNYTLNGIGLIGSNAWYGYANSSRRIAGIFSDDAASTFVTESAGMIPSDARAYALAPTATNTPVPLQNFYFSDTPSGGVTPAPFFFAGMTFQGRFQGPYGVAATSGVSLNQSVAGPIPHRGLAFNRALAGSRIQYCRFQGFGYDLKASPPYELAGFESNYDNGLVIDHCEFDGRLPTGEVACGGYMVNYASKMTMTNSWIHDTRRSGFALHENQGGNGGDYSFSNNRIEHVANTSDGFAGSGLGFNASNVEEASGTLSYDNCSFALDLGYHIALGTTNGGPVAKAINVTNFTSLSSAYNGCLVIRIIGTPNGSGISPYETLYQSGGLSALPFKVINNNITLTPVAASSFSSAIHTPDKFYIVVTS